MKIVKEKKNKTSILKCITKQLSSKDVLINNTSFFTTNRYTTKRLTLYLVSSVKRYFLISIYLPVKG